MSMILSPLLLTDENNYVCSPKSFLGWMDSGGPAREKADAASNFSGGFWRFG
jgi:hypothetical protein